MAGTSLDIHFDLEKTARHIVRLPTLQADRGWRELATYREQALRGHPKQIIDPLSFASRRQIAYDELAAFESHQNPGSIVIEPADVYQCVLSIVQTPRMLKSLIRLTDQMWCSMPGEVDIDALIVANTLRLRYGRDS